MRKDPLLRFVLILFAGFLFFCALYFAKSILIPLSFSALLSMLILPLCKKLEHWKFPRWLAILSCFLVAIIIIGAFVTLFIFQVISFTDNLPMYKELINSKIGHIQRFLEGLIKVSPKDQTAFMKEKMSGFMSNGGEYIKVAFVETTGTFATIGIVFICTFFFLYFRDRFKNFILKIANPIYEEKTRMIITASSKVAARYLSGVFIVIIILSVLNSVGLMIIGLDNAIFFGISVAILNIIPYIGVPIGAVLPVVMALITRESLWSAVGVIAVFSFNQFIENNFLTPNIVGNKVNINPLATIIVLLIGGNLWGVSGMIIFLPFLGVLKITLDHVKPLNPYAYLISTDETETSILSRIKSLFNRKK
ncbi:AI-2E family transporter [Sporocytophaga myxococcoides]|uniref:AI-2E family transporter n=1 Tax=Sporocytophaga myxococcoides TaxID=153721 RepID=UPI00138B05FC|nr:AI-2E family transporter [Sporocytophaga myxococcoides]